MKESLTQTKGFIDNFITQLEFGKNVVLTQDFVQGETGELAESIKIIEIQLKQATELSTGLQNIINSYNKPYGWICEESLGLNFKEETICPKCVPLYLHPDKSECLNLDENEVIEAVARGWCRDGNTAKQMDVELTNNIVTEIMQLCKK